MSLKAIVRFDLEVVVDLPGGIPEDAVDENGEIIADKYREAAVGAAVSLLRRDAEIDVSAALDMPFHTITRGTAICSFAKCSADVSDSDVTEVRAE